MPQKRFYITTAIDYVNDVIHVGHAYQKVAADVLSRHYRQKLGAGNVYFLTGTDEHGQKPTEAAEKLGRSVEDFVAGIAAADKKEQDALDVSYDRFIRTTDEDHIALVNEFWRRSFKNGDIYLGDFDGLYCVGCEEFKTKSELVEGRCALHSNQELKVVREKNYFFRWKKYRGFLKEWIDGHPDFILPPARRNEMLAFVDKIEDITISRRKESVPWGIPVPDDASQVIYVWFDALINYLTAGLANGFWDEETKIVHILGKDNLRWHALLWPAMLKSAGYRLPDTVYAHGFLKLNGQKISKSLGNIIRPTELVKEFGVDPVRYYLLRHTSFSEDSDVSVDKIKGAYNSDLANGLGNFAARVLTLGEKLDDGNFKSHDIDPAIDRTIADTHEKVAAYLETFAFNEALAAIWDLIAFGDRYVNENKPWEKFDGRIVWGLIVILDNVSALLEPFLPGTAEKITASISWEGRKLRVKKPAPLFPRLK